MPTITASNRFKAFIISVATDGVLYEGDWINSTILNSGLDRIADEPWYTQPTYCAVGDDSAAAMISQGGLVSELERSNDYAPGFIFGDGLIESCDNLTDGTNGRVLWRRSFDFDEPVAPVTYREVGISSQSGSGDNLFSRAVLPNIPVVVGRFLRIVYELTVRVEHGPSRSPVTLAVDGWASTQMVPALLWWNVAPFPNGSAGYNGSYSTMAGSSDPDHATLCEPSRKGNDGVERFFFCFLIGTDDPLPAWPDVLGDNTDNRTTDNIAILTEDEVYVAGDYHKDYTASFPVGFATGTVRTIGLSVSDSDDPLDHVTDESHAQHMWLLAADRDKAADHSLVLRFRVSWGRA